MKILYVLIPVLAAGFVVNTSCSAQDDKVGAFRLPHLSGWQEHVEERPATTVERVFHGHKYTASMPYTKTQDYSKTTDTSKIVMSFTATKLDRVYSDKEFQRQFVAGSMVVNRMNKFTGLPGIAAGEYQTLQIAGHTGFVSKSSDSSSQQSGKTQAENVSLFFCLGSYLYSFSSMTRGNSITANDRKVADESWGKIMNSLNNGKVESR